MALEADAALRSAVADALGRPVGGLLDVRREPLEYDAFLAHRSVTRLTGQAIVAGDRVPWSLIEKRTEGLGLAEPYLLDNGRREFDAYRSGLLDDIAPGIRAPRAHGSLLDADGRITLWLEEVHHEGARPLDAPALLGAARDLGGLNGRWLGCRLDEPWYFTGWIDRHGQPGAVANGLATVRRSHPDAVSRLGERLGSIEHLILRQDAVRLILESMPQTVCHHDAVGANVFSLRGGTVLIDWESVGPGPLGADLASLLFSSVRRGDASIVVVERLLDDALQAYADGLGRGGASVEFADVQRGFDAAVALRWKLAVDVVAGLETGEALRRGSLSDEPPEAAVDELVQLVDILLAAAGRALD